MRTSLSVPILTDQLSGWAWKSTESGSTWKKIWMTLHKTPEVRLCLYKKPVRSWIFVGYRFRALKGKKETEKVVQSARPSPSKSVELKKEFFAKNISSVRAVEEFRGKNNVFKLVTGQKIFYFSVNDLSERSQWVNAIHSALPKKQELRKAVPNAGRNFIGDAMLSKFEKIKVIGKGGFSTVYLVKKKDEINSKKNQFYAMKVIKEKHQLPKQQELRILAKIHHPFLMKLHWSFETASELYFIMDFVAGGNLWFHLKNTEFSEARVRFYAAQIVCGLEYLHNKGIVFRDLKPDNILIADNGYIKLTDFGLSKEGMGTESARTSTLCGTVTYMAPEIISGLPYTKSVDWWSMGVVLYEMISGNVPFPGNSRQEIYRKILSEEISYGENMSESAKNLLRGFLQRDREVRLSDTEKIRSHDFFSQISWEDLENCRIPPPFIPKLSSADDVHYVDPEMLGIPIDGEEISEMSEFSNWTFVEERGEGEEGEEGEEAREEGESGEEIEVSARDLETEKNSNHNSNNPSDNFSEENSEEAASSTDDEAHQKNKHTKTQPKDWKSYVENLMEKQNQKPNEDEENTGKNNSETYDFPEKSS